jgi:hypothetical protein
MVGWQRGADVVAFTGGEGCAAFDGEGCAAVDGGSSEFCCMGVKRG